jgi:hypothetical protein
MLELADVFRLYGPTYLQRFGDRMPYRHLQAIQDIRDCRTEALGGHVFQCENCDKLYYSYHSCFNRSCPKCSGPRTETWLMEREAEMLPVPYFHVVFTVPHETHALFQTHPAVAYGLLMQAAAQSLIKLCRDPPYVGGLVGVLCVLHTWTRMLAKHPHVHCLVPAGGVCLDSNQWLPAKKSFLVPVRALSKIFKGIFRDLLRKHLPDVSVPRRAWKKKWCVWSRAIERNTDTILTYLARYVHRVAISNSRLVSIDDGQVTFRYQDSETSQWRPMSLPAEEFIRRFLQHVLPKGFHKVRYYGLWSPPYRSVLKQLQLILSPPERSPHPLEPFNPLLSPDFFPEDPSDLLPCPFCGQKSLVLIEIIPRRPRAPPCPSHSLAPPS